MEQAGDDNLGLHFELVGVGDAEVAVTERHRPHLQLVEVLRIANGAEQPVAQTLGEALVFTLGVLLVERLVERLGASVGDAGEIGGVVGRDGAAQRAAGQGGELEAGR